MVIAHTPQFPSLLLLKRATVTKVTRQTLGVERSLSVHAISLQSFSLFQTRANSERRGDSRLWKGTWPAQGCIADQLDTTLPRGFPGTREATLLRHEMVSPPGCRAGGTIMPCVLWVDPGVQGSRQEVEPLFLAGCCELALSSRPFFSCSEIKGLKGLVLSRNLFALR